MIPEAQEGTLANGSRHRPPHALNLPPLHCVCSIPQSSLMSPTLLSAMPWTSLVTTGRSEGVPVFPETMTPARDRYLESPWEMPVCTGNTLNILYSGSRKMHSGGIPRLILTSGGKKRKGSFN